jgi:large subunit ribosomal protein L17
MRHRVASRRLGRQTAHRLSMLSNLAKSLIQHRRITTTETRAKELSKYVERLITLAKTAHSAVEPKDKLHAKRQVFAELPGAPRRNKNSPVFVHRDIGQTLFAQIAATYSADGGSAREGGYTRITRLYPRAGDGAPMVFIELV